MKQQHFVMALVAGGMALALLSACHRSNNGNFETGEMSAVAQVNNEYIQPGSLDDMSDIRRPDVKIHVRRGQPLAIRTKGLMLTAIDAAVRHEADYSVTSLVAEELPPLPQGMMNMTAATAGYRLLPGGEHFMPYAELRVAYDPERLPKGYTPNDIYTSFYDTSTFAWVRLERVGVDTVNHEIVSLTTHFTDFINELLKAPEMPETQAFVPTAMSDLEAVSPTDGLTIITPPDANNEGSANLCYPIQIPSGRAGMQPNLSVNYSSAGGNGWLGVGWDLSVPSITLDTRWGVPRYDAIYETEIYLLSGEQLITRDGDGNPRPMPHRTNRQTPRSTLGDNVRFYARTGDAHDSIIRHNTSTASYWWEVVDRNGVTHYYGHYPNNALNTSSHPTTLKDDQGNIAKWMLAESRDAYGNWVRYYYEVDTTGGSVPGRQIYPEHIEYTGCNDDSGNYKVVFVRKDRDPQDIPVSCNLGFKEVTSKELCYIQIYLDSGLAEDHFSGNGYYFDKELKYESNFKTRLKAIYMTPYDHGGMDKWCDGDTIPDNGYVNRQDFLYYDAPVPSQLFSAEQYESTLDEDNISAFMLTPNFQHDTVTSATALGLTHSSNWSIGGTVGIGAGANVAFTTFSIGGNFHWGESASESLLTLTDLDGDGLADKVFVRNNTLYWRKQSVPQNGIISFGGVRPISGPDHFLVENGKTSALGVQANVAMVGGSGSWSSTTSTTSTYFADVDGDGLVDIIHEGEVFFNRLNEYGDPVFSRYSNPVREVEEPGDEVRQTICDSIIFDGEVNDTVACDRIWIAVSTNKCPDSVLVAQYIQNHLGDENYAAVFIRDSSGQGYVVEYEAVLDCSRRNLAGRGVPNTESVRVWVAPDSGTVNIDAYVRLVEDTSADHRKSRHSDGITYVIQHSHGVSQSGAILTDSVRTILASDYICDLCRDVQYETHCPSLTVRRGDVLFFRLQSMDDKQFDNVEDNVDIYFNGVLYNSRSAFLLTDDNYFQAPDTGYYSVEWMVRSLNNDLHVTLEKGNLVAADFGNIMKDATLQVTVTSDSVNANWDNTDVCAKIRFWNDDTYDDTITFWTVGKKSVRHPAGSVWGNATYQHLFGPLYKGWGQFSYKPNDTSPLEIPLDRLVVPSRLRIGDMGDDDQRSIENQINNTSLDSNDFNVSSIEEFENAQPGIDNTYNPLNDSTFWVEMNVDAEHNRWVAYGGHNSIGRDTMSNTMQKRWYDASSEVAAAHAIDPIPSTAFDDAVPPASADGTPAKAILKVNESSNQSYTLGVVSVNAAYSKGSSTIETDYLDMNGDRYPDIVGKGGVQYRQQWGGMGSLKGMPFGINDVSVSVTNSAGIGFGASSVSHNRTTSVQPAQAKFTLSGDGNGGGVNGDISIGWDHASSSWTDINGDGLPDYVSDNGNVRLNTGYTFLNKEDWLFTSDHALRSGMSVSGSASGTIPLNSSQGSIQLGAGLSRSANRTDHSLMDINGDGLPDLIWRNVLDFQDINRLSDLTDPFDSIHIKFNLGNGQWSEPYNLNIKNFNWGESYNESLNVGITGGVTFCSVLKATVGVNGTPYSSGTNRDRMQLVDVNGDGLPDLVTSGREANMTVRYNKAGKTNLLYKVTNSTGGEVYFYYHLSDPDYMQPSRTWLFDMVTTHDPLNPNGSDTTVTVFEYENPNYNRFERTSFGYGTVTTKQINPDNDSTYRKVTRKYLNTNILNKGRIKSELTSDGNGNKYIKKEYFYDYTSYDGGGVDTCSGNAYSSRDRVVTSFYEGAPSSKLTTAETRQYDLYHNIIRYVDEGDTAYNDDGLMVDFAYYTSQPNNLIGLRQEYKVYPTGSSSPLRQAQFQYNSQGKLTRQILGSGPDAAIYDFDYDPVYGNLTRARQPQNLNGQRMTYVYSYDPVVHTYPVSISNSHGEVTTTTYSYRFCKPLTVTDPSGNTITYDYDCLGRVIDVRSPLNGSDTSSLRNFYYTKGCLGYYNFAWYNYHNWNYYDHRDHLGAQMFHPHPYSVTEHFDDHGRLITRTVVLTDGFGRILQTKKGLTDGGVPSMQVSGRTMTDHFGRTTRQYDPFTVADTALASLGIFETYADSSATVTRFDILDRPTEVRQPLGVTTLTDYDIMNDAGGRRRFYTRVTDPDGNVTMQYSDYDGRQVQMTDADNGITLTHYDNLGQILSSSDPEGFTTYYRYDNLGRLINRDHPDAGTTKYDYDPAGNVVREINPLGQINYGYTYYRMTHKRYNYMPGNDVTYTYGTSGNETGRPVRIVDGGGTYECRYDALGNVVDEIRTIALPQHSEVYRFRMLYRYDSWGRMLSMTYPDGEEIKYGYLWGGDLRYMTGMKNGDSRNYIKHTLYNSYGQKSHVEYGNRTSADYTYDALHRLSHLQSRDANGTLMQDIDYTFDNASNVTGIDNNAGVANTLGGTYGNTYKYDALHRLIASDGNGGLGTYQLGMGYTPSGRIKDKHRKRRSALASDSVRMSYGYCDNDQPHAVRRIFDHENRTLYDMRWDKAGNLGQVSVADRDALFESGRFLYWTEDNRMHTAVDDRYYSYYAYDYGGERRLKLTGKNDLLDVNADFMATVTLLDEPTLYPSAYMVLTNRGYTKHYYAGAERVAARLGGGGLDALNRTVVDDVAIRKKADALFDKSREQVGNRVLRENSLGCIMSSEFAMDEFGYCIDGIPKRMKAMVQINNDPIKSMVNDMLVDRGQGREPDVFFYHSDHLGSASWITDHAGDAVQHLQYLPYGERYIDQHPFGYSERFTFTGKELDEETGYGYFGARYMDHELMTGWLSVDPMADKYPSMSPYNYCAWNPMKLVDPDGREIGDYYSRNGTYLGWDGQINNKVYIVDDKEILEKDHNNNINTNNVTPLVSTTYETLEAVVGVFERTINNGGGNEESTAVIAGCSAIRGEQGYMGFDGKPHCEFPFLTEDQESLGVTSIHSHPFVEGYSIIEPSADDKALFGSCDMNIIVGPKGGSIWAAFFKPSSDRITELRINSIEKIVNNRQNASNRRWGLLCKDL